MGYQSSFMNQNMPTSAKGAATANPYGAAAMGGISMVGDMIATSKQNHAARRAAKHQRDFQMVMSSTAHQREVADLKAAGLNPILSGTGGLGASTGSSANAVVNKPDLVKSMQGGISATSARAQAVIARNAMEMSNDKMNVWRKHKGIMAPVGAGKDMGLSDKAAAVLLGVDKAPATSAKVLSKKRFIPYTKEWNQMIMRTQANHGKYWNQPTVKEIKLRGKFKPKHPKE